MESSTKVGLGIAGLVLAAVIIYSVTRAPEPVAQPTTPRLPDQGASQGAADFASVANSLATIAERAARIASDVRTQNATLDRQRAADAAQRERDRLIDRSGVFRTGEDSSGGKGSK